MFIESNFFKASEYIGVAFWKISLVNDRSDSLLLTNLGNSLRIVFGWLEFFLMYTGWLSGFLYSSKMLVCKSKVKFWKFTIHKFDLMVILSPQPWNTLMTFFFTLSVSGPDKPFNIARPLSLNNPTEWCSKSLFHCCKI